MHHPDIVIQLQGVDDTVGAAALLDHQLPNTGAKTSERLGDGRRPAIGHDRQRIERLVDRTGRERSEILARYLDPRNRSKRWGAT